MSVFRNLPRSPFSEGQGNVPRLSCDVGKSGRFYETLPDGWKHIPGGLPGILHMGGSPEVQTPDTVPEAGRRFPHFPAGQTYRWNTEAFRPASTLLRPGSECFFEVLRKTQGRVPPMPSSSFYLSGTFLRRSTERRSEFYQNIPGSSPSAFPAPRSGQAYFRFRTVRDSLKVPWPGSC